MKNKIVSLFGDRELPDIKVAYSALLEKILSKFHEHFEDFEFIDDIFEFVIMVWNSANLKNLMKEDFELNESITLLQNYPVKIELFKEMMDYKLTHFKQYTNFIVDYIIEERNNEQILTVVTQTEESYLDGIKNHLDEEKLKEESENNYINRIGIIVKPQQPFINWYNNLDFVEDDIDESDLLINTYLIDKPNPEEWLKKKFDNLFTMELEEHCENKKLWPQKRNFKMFKEWFRVEISEFIYDLEYKPVSKY